MATWRRDVRNWLHVVRTGEVGSGRGLDAHRKRNECANKVVQWLRIASNRDLVSVWAQDVEDEAGPSWDSVCCDFCRLVDWEASGVKALHMTANGQIKMDAGLKSSLAHLETVLSWSAERGPVLDYTPSELLRLAREFVGNDCVCVLAGKTVLRLVRDFLGSCPLYLHRMSGLPESGLPARREGDTGGSRGMLSYAMQETAAVLAEAATGTVVAPYPESAAFDVGRPSDAGLGGEEGGGRMRVLVLSLFNAIVLHKDAPQGVPPNLGALLLEMAPGPKDYLLTLRVLLAAAPAHDSGDPSHAAPLVEPLALCVRLSKWLAETGRGSPSAPWAAEAVRAFTNLEACLHERTAGVGWTAAAAKPSFAVHGLLEGATEGMDAAPWPAAGLRAPLHLGRHAFDQWLEIANTMIALLARASGPCEAIAGATGRGAAAAAPGHALVLLAMGPFLAYSATPRIFHTLISDRERRMRPAAARLFCAALAASRAGHCLIAHGPGEAADGSCTSCDAMRAGGRAGGEPRCREVRWDRLRLPLALPPLERGTALALPPHMHAHGSAPAESLGAALLGTHYLSPAWGRPMAAPLRSSASACTAKEAHKETEVVFPCFLRMSQLVLGNEDWLNQMTAREASGGSGLGERILRLPTDTSLLWPEPGSMLALAGECLYTAHAAATAMAVGAELGHGEDAFAGYPAGYRADATVLCLPRLLTDISQGCESRAGPARTPAVLSLLGGAAAGHKSGAGPLRAADLSDRLELLAAGIALHPDLLPRGTPTAALLSSLSSLLAHAPRSVDSGPEVCLTAAALRLCLILTRVARLGVGGEGSDGCAGTALVLPPPPAIPEAAGEGMSALAPLATALAGTLGSTGHGVWEPWTPFRPSGLAVLSASLLPAEHGKRASAAALVHAAPQAEDAEGGMEAGLRMRHAIGAVADAATAAMAIDSALVNAVAVESAAWSGLALALTKGVLRVVGGPVGIGLGGDRLAALSLRALSAVLSLRAADQSAGWQASSPSFTTPPTGALSSMLLVRCDRLPLPSVLMTRTLTDALLTLPLLTPVPEGQTRLAGGGGLFAVLDRGERGEVTTLPAAEVELVSVLASILPDTAWIHPQGVPNTQASVDAALGEAAILLAGSERAAEGDAGALAFVKASQGGRLLVWTATRLENLHADTHVGLSRADAVAALEPALTTLYVALSSRFHGEWARAPVVAELPGARLSPYGTGRAAYYQGCEAASPLLDVEASEADVRVGGRPFVRLWGMQGSTVGTAGVSIPATLPLLRCIASLEGAGPGMPPAVEAGRDPFAPLACAPPRLAVLEDRSHGSAALRVRAASLLAPLAISAASIMGVAPLWPCLTGSARIADGRAISDLPGAAAISLSSACTSLDTAVAGTGIAVGLVARHASCPTPLHVVRACSLLRTVVALGRSLPPLPGPAAACGALVATLTAFIALWSPQWVGHCLGTRSVPEGPPQPLSILTFDVEGAGRQAQSSDAAAGADRSGGGVSFGPAHAVSLLVALRTALEALAEYGQTGLGAYGGTVGASIPIPAIAARFDLFPGSLLPLVSCALVPPIATACLLNLQAHLALLVQGPALAELEHEQSRLALYPTTPAHCLALDLRSALLEGAQSVVRGLAGLDEPVGAGDKRSASIAALPAPGRSKRPAVTPATSSVRLMSIMPTWAEEEEEVEGGGTPSRKLVSFSTFVMPLSSVISHRMDVEEKGGGEEDVQFMKARQVLAHDGARGASQGGDWASQAPSGGGHGLRARSRSAYRATAGVSVARQSDGRHQLAGDAMGLSDNEEERREEEDDGMGISAVKAEERAAGIELLRDIAALRMRDDIATLVVDTIGLLCPASLAASRHLYCTSHVALKKLEAVGLGSASALRPLQPAVALSVTTLSRALGWELGVDGGRLRLGKGGVGPALAALLRVCCHVSPRELPAALPAAAVVATAIIAFGASQGQGWHGVAGGLAADAAALLKAASQVGAFATRALLALTARLRQSEVISTKIGAPCPGTDACATAVAVQAALCILSIATRAGKALIRASRAGGGELSPADYSRLLWAAPIRAMEDAIPEAVYEALPGLGTVGDIAPWGASFAGEEGTVGVGGNTSAVLLVLALAWHACGCAGAVSPVAITTGLARLLAPVLSCAPEDGIAIALDALRAADGVSGHMKRPHRLDLSPGEDWILAELFETGLRSMGGGGPGAVCAAGAAAEALAHFARVITLDAKGRDIYEPMVPTGSGWRPSYGNTEIPRHGMPFLRSDAALTPAVPVKGPDVPSLATGLTSGLWLLEAWASSCEPEVLPALCQLLMRTSNALQSRAVHACLTRVAVARGHGAGAEGVAALLRSLMPLLAQVWLVRAQPVGSFPASLAGFSTVAECVAAYARDWVVAACIVGAARRLAVVTSETAGVGAGAGGADEAQTERPFFSSLREAATILSDSMRLPTSPLTATPPIVPKDSTLTGLDCPSLIRLAVAGAGYGQWSGLTEVAEVAAVLSVSVQSAVKTHASSALACAVLLLSHREQPREANIELAAVTLLGASLALCVAEGMGNGKTKSEVAPCIEALLERHTSHPAKGLGWFMSALTSMCARPGGALEGGFDRQTAYATLAALGGAACRGVKSLEGKTAAAVAQLPLSALLLPLHEHLDTLVLTARAVSGRIAAPAIADGPDPTTSALERAFTVTAVIGTREILAFLAPTTGKDLSDGGDRARMRLALAAGLLTAIAGAALSNLSSAPAFLTALGPLASASLSLGSTVLAAASKAAAEGEVGVRAEPDAPIGGEAASTLAGLIAAASMAPAFACSCALLAVSADAGGLGTDAALTKAALDALKSTLDCLAPPPFKTAPIAGSVAAPAHARVYNAVRTFVGACEAVGKGGEGRGHSANARVLLHLAPVQEVHGPAWAANTAASLASALGQPTTQSGPGFAWAAWAASDALQGLGPPVLCWEGTPHALALPAMAALLRLAAGTELDGGYEGCGSQPPPPRALLGWRLISLATLSEGAHPAVRSLAKAALATLPRGLRLTGRGADVEEETLAAAHDAGLPSTTVAVPGSDPLESWTAHGGWGRGPFAEARGTLTVLKRGVDGLLRVTRSATLHTAPYALGPGATVGEEEEEEEEGEEKLRWRGAYSDSRSLADVSTLPACLAAPRDVAESLALAAWRRAPPPSASTLRSPPTPPPHAPTLYAAVRAIGLQAECLSAAEASAGSGRRGLSGFVAAVGACLPTSLSTGLIVCVPGRYRALLSSWGGSALRTAQAEGGDVGKTWNLAAACGPLSPSLALCTPPATLAASALGDALHPALWPAASTHGTALQVALLSVGGSCEPAIRALALAALGEPSSSHVAAALLPLAVVGALAAGEEELLQARLLLSQRGVRCPPAYASSLPLRGPSGEALTKPAAASMLLHARRVERMASLQQGVRGSAGELGSERRRGESLTVSFARVALTQLVHRLALGSAGWAWSALGLLQTIRWAMVRAGPSSLAASDASKFAGAWGESAPRAYEACLFDFGVLGGGGTVAMSPAVALGPAGKPFAVSLADAGLNFPPDSRIVSKRTGTSTMQNFHEVAHCTCVGETSSLAALAAALAELTPSHVHTRALGDASEASMAAAQKLAVETAALLSKKESISHGCEWIHLMLTPMGGRALPAQRPLGNAREAASYGRVVLAHAALSLARAERTIITPGNMDADDEPQFEDASRPTGVQAPPTLLGPALNGIWEGPLAIRWDLDVDHTALAARKLSEGGRGALDAAEALLGSAASAVHGSLSPLPIPTRVLGFVSAHDEAARAARLGQGSGDGRGDGPSPGLLTRLLLSLYTLPPLQPARAAEAAGVASRGGFGSLPPLAPGEQSLLDSHAPESARDCSALGLGALMAGHRGDWAAEGVLRAATVARRDAGRAARQAEEAGAAPLLGSWSGPWTAEPREEAGGEAPRAVDAILTAAMTGAAGVEAASGCMVALCPPTLSLLLLPPPSAIDTHTIEAFTLALAGVSAPLYLTGGEGAMLARLACLTLGPPPPSRTAFRREPSRPVVVTPASSSPPLSALLLSSTLTSLARALGSAAEMRALGRLPQAFAALQKLPPLPADNNEGAWLSRVWGEAGAALERGEQAWAAGEAASAIGSSQEGAAWLACAAHVISSSDGASAAPNPPWRTLSLVLVLVRLSRTLTLLGQWLEQSGLDVPGKVQAGREGGHLAVLDLVARLLHMRVVGPNVRPIMTVAQLLKPGAPSADAREYLQAAVAVAQCVPKEALVGTPPSLPPPPAPSAPPAPPVAEPAPGEEEGVKRRKKAPREEVVREEGEVSSAGGLTDRAGSIVAPPRSAPSLGPVPAPAPPPLAPFPPPSLPAPPPLATIIPSLASQARAHLALADAADAAAERLHASITSRAALADALAVADLRRRVAAMTSVYKELTVRVNFLVRKEGTEVQAQLRAGGEYAARLGELKRAGRANMYEAWVDNERLLELDRIALAEIVEPVYGSTVSKSGFSAQIRELKGQLSGQESEAARAANALMSYRRAAVRGYAAYLRARAGAGGEWTAWRMAAGGRAGVHADPVGGAADVRVALRLVMLLFVAADADAEAARGRLEASPSLFFSPAGTTPSAGSATERISRTTSKGPVPSGGAATAQSTTALPSGGARQPLGSPPAASEDGRAPFPTPLAIQAMLLQELANLLPSLPIHVLLPALPQLVSRLDGSLTGSTGAGAGAGAATPSEPRPSISLRLLQPPGGPLGPPLPTLVELDAWTAAQGGGVPESEGAQLAARAHALQAWAAAMPTTWSFQPLLRLLVLRALLASPHRTALHLLALERSGRVRWSGADASAASALAAATSSSKRVAAGEVLAYAAGLSPRLARLLASTRLLSDVYVSAASRGPDPVIPLAKGAGFPWGGLALQIGSGPIKDTRIGGGDYPEAVPGGSVAEGAPLSFLSQPWAEGLRRDMPIATVEGLLDCRPGRGGGGGGPLMRHSAAAAAALGAGLGGAPAAVAALFDALSGRGWEKAASWGPALTYALSEGGVVDAYALPTHLTGLGQGYLHVADGLHAPRKVLARGSNGRTYSQLLKGGFMHGGGTHRGQVPDDPRLDASLQGFFRVANALLAADPRTASRRLAMRTFRVVPLTPTTGLLEWVPGCVGIRNWTDSQPWNAVARYNPGEMSYNAAQSHEDAGVEGVDPRRIAFDEVCAARSPVLHRWHSECAPEPSAWVAHVNGFSSSLATSTIVTHLVGVGDRHGSNVLLCPSDGALLHIDFGFVFESGRYQSLPELVPTRLTREMGAGCGASGLRGNFETGAELVIGVLRGGSSPLLGYLSVLLGDPLIKWQVGGAGERAGAAAAAAAALAQVQRKLRGLEFGAGAGGGGREGDSLPPRAQVARLVADSQSPANLSQMFHGWGAWL